ncbi:elongation factor P hydroxylase [Marinobacter sp. X15-166B]|uniref:elongation factor P hydroxylase n=1 Tax=Marinobacter sp. X15-166B TaxID=1897620 RepID=UPI000AF6E2C7|nr:elongation factor P hydroxylase [Marinobacter sp. X15-166B]
MLFNDQFRETHDTILVLGGTEPEYLPATEAGAPAKVIFAHGFFASALHEIAHWCIAGAERRKLPDYGYWYCPDGRTAAQQQLFERVEVKPQALEWLFSVAADFRFHISVDNLNGAGAVDAAGFRLRVRDQADQYLLQGLPARAQAFLQTLMTFYGTTDRFHSQWQRQRLNTGQL